VKQAVGGGLLPQRELLSRVREIHKEQLGFISKFPFFSKKNNWLPAERWTMTKCSTVGDRPQGL